MLNLIVVESDKAFTEKNKIQPVNFQMHHVLEMFMYYLSKVDLDGSTKLTIYFKDEPEGAEKYRCDKHFKVSWYYVGIESVSKLKSGIERDSYYLERLVVVLKEIAEINHCADSVFRSIEETAAKVREQAFQLQIPIKKLSKISKDKKYKAMVYRSLCSKGEMWQVEIVEKGGMVKKVDLLEDYTHISKEGLYFKAEWQEDSFVLLDHLGRLMAKVLPKEVVLQLYSLKGLRKTLPMEEMGSITYCRERNPK